MPTVSDIKLKKVTTDPRLIQMFQEIVAILNEGGYEEKIYSQAPTTGSPGFPGEVRIVITGAVVKTYKYVNGSWYSSQAFDLVT